MRSLLLTAMIFGTLVPLVISLRFQLTLDDFYFEMPAYSRFTLYRSLILNDFSLPRIIQSHHHPFSQEFLNMLWSPTTISRLVMAFASYPSVHPIIFPFSKVLKDDNVYGAILNMSKETLYNPGILSTIPKCNNTHNKLKRFSSLLQRHLGQWTLVGSISWGWVNQQLNLKVPQKVLPSWKTSQLLNSSIQAPESPNHLLEFITTLLSIIIARRENFIIEDVKKALNDFIEKEPLLEIMRDLETGTFSTNCQPELWQLSYNKLKSAIINHENLTEKRDKALFHVKLYVIVCNLLSPTMKGTFGGFMANELLDIMNSYSINELTAFYFKKCIACFISAGWSIDSASLPSMWEGFMPLTSKILLVTTSLEYHVQYWQRKSWLATTGLQLVLPSSIQNWSEAFDSFAVDKIDDCFILSKKLPSTVFVGQKSCDTIVCILREFTALFNSRITENIFTLQHLGMVSMKELKAILRLLVSNIFYRCVIGMNIDEDVLSFLYRDETCWPQSKVMEEFRKRITQALLYKCLQKEQKN